MTAGDVHHILLCVVVVCVVSLTVNLQLIMTTFYEPTQERHKVLMEAQVSAQLFCPSVRIYLSLPLPNLTRMLFCVTFV